MTEQKDRPEREAYEAWATQLQAKLGPWPPTPRAAFYEGWACAIEFMAREILAAIKCGVRL